MPIAKVYIFVIFHSHNIEFLHTCIYKIGHIVFCKYICLDIKKK